MNFEDDKSMAALALALAQSPGATYQEIAVAVGVSRATLYRFCSSRDELVRRLLRHALDKLTKGLAAARLDEGDPLEALTRLIDEQVAHRELHAFAMEFWTNETEREADLAPACLAYETALDAFFLRGQREGVFRIDIPAVALNEGLSWLLIGLIDAERRGRLARTSVPATIKALFIEGALKRE